MQTIHKIAKIINNQVVIEMPPDFGANTVEVILRSLTEKDSKIYGLEREIDIGIKSSVSSHAHEEIFNKLRKKYESYQNRLYNQS